MVPRISQGRSVGGMVRYAVSEKPERHDDPKRPRGRVAWTATRNLPTEDPQLASRIMQGVINDSDAIKRRSGRRGGRHKQKPAVHLVLSLHRSEIPVEDVHKRKAELLRIADEALKSVGLDRAQAVVVAHEDRDHLHLHIVASRVSLETGLAVNMKASQKRLSAWAGEYEKRNNRVVCPARLARQQRRDLPAKDRGPVPRSATRTGPGREPRSEYETAAWRTLYTRHRLEKTAPDIAKRERIELNRWLQSRRVLQETIHHPINALRRLVRGEAPPAPKPVRHPSHPWAPAPRRHAAPVDAATAPRRAPSVAAPPRPPLRVRVRNRIRNEDRRVQRATARQEKAQAAEQARIAAERLAAQADQMVEQARRDAEEAALARERTEHWDKYNRAMAERAAQQRATQTRPQTALPPRRTDEQQHAPPQRRSILEELQEANAAEDRIRARHGGVLPHERLITAPTEIKPPRPATQTQPPKPKATRATPPKPKATRATPPKPKTTKPKPKAAKPKPPKARTLKTPPAAPAVAPPLATTSTTPPPAKTIRR